MAMDVKYEIYLLEVFIPYLCSNSDCDCFLHEAASYHNSIDLPRCMSSDLSRGRDCSLHGHFETDVKVANALARIGTEGNLGSLAQIRESICYPIQIPSSFSETFFRFRDRFMHSHYCGAAAQTPTILTFPPCSIEFTPETELFL